MASGSISGGSSWSGADRYVVFSISSDYGSSTCNWSCRSYSTTSSNPVTRIALYVNGGCVSDSGYVRNWTSYPTGKDYTITGSCTVPASGYVSFSFGAGVGHDNTTDIQQSGSILKVGTPSINTPGISSITRTTAYSSFSVSNNAGHAIVDNYIDCGTYNFGNVVSTISSTSGTFSGLTPNTTYYVRANASNGTYRGYSSVTSFTTSGNAPSVTRGTVTPTRTSCLINPSVSYDTNDSFSSKTLEYGTTTAYGSTSSDGTNLYNLSPNTTYYYKVSVTSTRGRTGVYEGQFQTLGNAPSIQYTYSSPTYTGGIITADVIYDTNAQFSSAYIEYGLTDNYELGNVTHTSSSWSIVDNNLEHNTDCYYRIRITDNFNRTSDWYTGKFTTSGDAPIIDSVDITDIKSKYVSFDINSTFDNNASFKSCWVMIYLNSAQVHAYTEYSANITTKELKPGKNYTIVVRVRDTFDRDSTDYSFDVKTKGGFKYEGKMSESIKINGKEVIGMKYNGNIII